MAGFMITGRGIGVVTLGSSLADVLLGMGFNVRYNENLLEDAALVILSKGKRRGALNLRELCEIRLATQGTCFSVADLPSGGYSTSSYLPFSYNFREASNVLYASGPRTSLGNIGPITVNASNPQEMLDFVLGHPAFWTYLSVRGLHPEPVGFQNIKKVTGAKSL